MVSRSRAHSAAASTRRAARAHPTKRDINGEVGDLGGISPVGHDDHQQACDFAVHFRDEEEVRLLQSASRSPSTVYVA